MSDKVVKIPAWAVAVFSLFGSTAVIALCSFMAWLASTTITQGMQLARIEAEVAALKGKLLNSLNTDNTCREETDGLK